MPIVTDLGGFRILAQALLLWALCNLLGRMQTYRLSNERRAVRDVLTAADKLRWAHRSGRNRVSGQDLPGLVIHFSTVIVTVTEYMGMHGDRDAVVHVWRWRWLAPLTSAEDSGDNDPEDGDVIRVITRSSNNVRDACFTEVSEIMLSDNVPDAARARSETVAADVLARCKARRSARAAMTVALSGARGAGKSSVARVLAHQWDAYLWDTYDPTRVGDCLEEVLRDYGDGGRIVVVMEEFDVMLRRVMAGSVEDTDDMRVDARDKSSWNTLLDKLARRVDVIVLLTTNKSRKELEYSPDLCNGDLSLLRPGRVDHWICMSGDTDAGAFGDDADDVAGAAPRPEKALYAASEEAAPVPSVHAPSTPASSLVDVPCQKMPVRPKWRC